MIRHIARLLVPKPVRRYLRALIDPRERQRQIWERDREMGKLVYQSTGGIVAGGPFRGLKYVDSAMGSTLGPKLLGTYEKELSGVVELIVQRGYAAVVNIGAGEGYYAVGLAKRLPQARIVCFEAMEGNRSQIQRLSQLNGVADRFSIHGLCTSELLAKTIAPDPAGNTRTLIVCDVEGAELEILKPDVVPALRQADLLVEMHDIIQKGLSDEIRGRFQQSHEIEVIWTAPRTEADWPAGVQIDPRQHAACLDEGRGGKMSWFWMKAR